MSIQPQIDACLSLIQPPIMNFIVWNSRGVLKPNFQNHVWELTRVHDPALLIIMETRLGVIGPKKLRIDFRMMVQFTQTPLGVPEVCGCCGIRRRWRCYSLLAQSRRFMFLSRSVILNFLGFFLLFILVLG